MINSGDHVKIDSHGYPESFSLTETDRQYFNIIKTEDGRSQFYKNSNDKLLTEHRESLSNDIKATTENTVKLNSHQSFRYHIVKTKSSKPIVGIYLPEH